MTLDPPVSRPIGAAFAVLLFALPSAAQGPPVHWATYLGGGDQDEVLAVGVAGNGDRIVAGRTRSGNFPVTAGAFDVSHNGSDDVFVARLSPDGTSVLAATFLGGSGADEAVFVQVGGDGSIWVGGSTTSANFPTTPDAFLTPAGRRDAFVANLDANLGALRYGTTMGNFQNDTGGAFAIDDANQQVWVAGNTESSAPVPTTATGLQPLPRGNTELFLVVLDRSMPGTTALAYGTLLGGVGADFAVGNLTLEGNGVATLCALSTSANFPTTPGAVQTAITGNDSAGVVVRIDTQTAGAAGLLYSSYVGGSGRESRIHHATDTAGNVHVLLHGNSPDLPLTANAMIAAPGPNGDAYYAWIDPAQSGAAGLRYASWVLTASTEEARAIAFAAGRVCMLIWTNGSGHPTTTGAFQPASNGSFHGYLLELDLGAQPAPAVFRATHYGGCGGTLEPQAMCYDGARVVMGGQTASTALPVTPGVAQGSAASSFDAFTSSLDLGPWPSSFSSFGNACPGTAGTPQLVGTSPARLCRTLRMTATGLLPNGAGLFLAGFDRTQYRGTALPFSLAPLGAPGCEVSVAPEVILLRLADGNGDATFHVALPGDTRLLGTVLFSQFALVDLQANALGLVTTNGLSAEVRW